MAAAESDLQLFRDCFVRNGGLRSMAALKWLYKENPTGELFVDVALAPNAEKLAAIYASLPVYLRIGDQRRLAIQSLDTLTDADFRGRGLFVQLAKSTFSRATGANVALVYGFPNAHSASGFFGKLGWTRLGPLPFLVRPLRTRYALARAPKVGKWLKHFPDLPLIARAPRLPPGYSLQEDAAFDDRYDDLWRRFASQLDIAVDRDSKYMNWRIRDKPGEHYHRLMVVGDDHQATACVIFAVKEKHGGRIGYLMDLISDPKTPKVAQALLRIAVHRMSTLRADLVLAWCMEGAPNHSLHRRAGFFTLPVSLRPIELHFGARAFDETIRDRVADRSNWYISYLDSDTV